MTEQHIPAWSLGDRLRKSREDAGLTQGELGQYVHAKTSTVSGWERDQHRPSRLALIAWADACRVPLDWLTGEVTASREGGGDGPTMWYCSAWELMIPSGVAA